MLVNLDYTDQVTFLQLSENVKQPRLENKTLGVRCIERGIILPFAPNVTYACGEVYTEDRLLVKGTNPNVMYDEEVVDITQELPPDLTYVNEDVIYLGDIVDCWGHFITDALSKLWVWDTVAFKSLMDKGVKVVCTISYKTVNQCPTSLRQVLKLAGVDCEVEIVQTSTQYRKVYIPDNSLFMKNKRRHYTLEYKKVVDKIIAQVPVDQRYTRYDKIYLSRTHFINKNADFGEKPIEKIFKSLGFHIIHPQEYSFFDQIAMLQSAKTVVSTAGSLAHNSVFCKEGTDVIILRKVFASQDYQQMINEVKNLNVTYIDAHLSLFVNDNPGLGPFFLYVNDNLVRFVKDCFEKVVHPNFSTKQFFKYARLCMQREDFSNRNRAPEYYYQKLRAELLKDNWKKKYYEVFDRIMPRQLMGTMKRIYYNLYR